MDTKKSNINPMLKLENKTTLRCACGNQFETYVIHIDKSHTPLSTICLDCRTKELKRIELEERENKERLRRQFRDRWERISGIPERFRVASFETFKTAKTNENVYRACLEYAEDYPPLGGKYHSLGLFSKNLWGVGKSHLACAIAHKVLDKWMRNTQDSPVWYLTEPDMFRKIRGTYNRQQTGDSEEELFDKLINIPLLIIDDVGKEEVADPRFVQRSWFSLINGRYDNELPVIITANLNPDEIANHLGGSRSNEATFDRLYEMLNGKLWEVTGKDYRRPAK